MAYKDLSGCKFGQLTCLRSAGRDNSRCVVWLCKCDCGAIVMIRSNSLLMGNTRSCGCLQKTIAKRSCKERSKHNMGLDCGRGDAQCANNAAATQS